METYTKDEIEAFLKTQGINIDLNKIKEPKLTPYAGSKPNVSPQPGASTSSVSSPSPVPKVRRTRAPKEEVPESERCSYVLISGVNAGKRCPNKKIENEIYCSGCLKKTEKKRETARKKKISPGQNISPAGASIMEKQAPNFLIKHDSIQDTMIKSYYGKSNVSVLSIGDGYYYGHEDYFVYRINGSTSKLIIVGKYDKEAGTVNELTMEEIAHIEKNLKLEYVASNEQLAKVRQLVSKKENQDTVKNITERLIPLKLDDVEESSGESENDED